MKKLALNFVCLFLIFISACSDKSTINQSEAGKVITKYLEANPEYKTVTFHYGELKFNSNKEREELKKYRDLAAQGYVDMLLISQKKQFLSKDSSFVYQVKLNNSVQDYILKQADQKATVKAVNYILSDKPVNFEQVNSKNAKVTVILIKDNTPFSPFQKKQDEFSETLTKTYKLKLHKEEGWKVDN